MPGVRLDRFLQTPLRRTFTYCKPLVVEPGKPPRELNRLDSKNWTPTPAEVERQLIAALGAEAERIDALVIMDQVDLAGTGVLTAGVLGCRGRRSPGERPQLRILADSRRGLHGYPAVCWKMNRAELGKLCGKARRRRTWSRRSMRRWNLPGGTVARCSSRLRKRACWPPRPMAGCIHSQALPIRGEIDIVGAGDSVTANLAAALAAGASPEESLELASAAASVVIHQLGTTGTASVQQIMETLYF